VISSLVCVSWRFYLGQASVPYVPCQSSSGARGIIVASKGILNVYPTLLMNIRWAAASFWLPWRRILDEEEKILYLDDFSLL